MLLRPKKDIFYFLNVILIILINILTVLLYQFYYKLPCDIQTNVFKFKEQQQLHRNMNKQEKCQDLVLQLREEFHCQQQSKPSKIRYVNIAQLTFIASGLQHAVYADKCSQQSVIIFRRVLKHKTKLIQLNKQIDKMMEGIYEKLMPKLFENLHKYRWPRKLMKISNTDENQLNKIYDQLKNIAVREAKYNGKIRIPSIDHFQLDHHFKDVFVSYNLFDVEKFNTIVQFKPKSLIPSLYSHQMLQKISNNAGISIQQIKQILKNSQYLEKCRWFKKNICQKDKMSKNEKNKQKKLNQNPFKIFGIGKYKQQLPRLTSTKGYKHFPFQKLTQEQEKKLNQNIYQLIHKQKQLLQELHLIQSLFINPTEEISKQILNKVNVSKLCDQEMLKYLQQKISQVLSSSRQAGLQSYEQFLQKTDCIYNPQSRQGEQTQMQVLSQLFLFLLSLTWKDISIIVKFQFDQKNDHFQLEGSQIWIIDDYLKEYTKVEENTDKEQKFLLAYIKWKINEKKLKQEKQIQQGNETSPQSSK